MLKSALLALAFWTSSTMRHCVTVLYERRLNHTPLFGTRVGRVRRCLNAR